MSEQARKIYMITGANRGFGKATSKALAKLGSTVVMVCARANLKFELAYCRKIFQRKDS